MFFFFNDTATTEIYTLSLHDALPISAAAGPGARRVPRGVVLPEARAARQDARQIPHQDEEPRARGAPGTRAAGAGAGGARRRGGGSGARAPLFRGAGAAARGARDRPVRVRGGRIVRGRAAATRPSLTAPRRGNAPGARARRVGTRVRRDPRRRLRPHGCPLLRGDGVRRGGASQPDGRGYSAGEVPWRAPGDARR